MNTPAYNAFEHILKAMEQAHKLQEQLMEHNKLLAAFEEVARKAKWK